MPPCASNDEWLFGAGDDAPSAADGSGTAPVGAGWEAPLVNRHPVLLGVSLKLFLLGGNGGAVLGDTVLLVDDAAAGTAAIIDDNG